jgi:hypothetical protein
LMLLIFVSTKFEAQIWSRRNEGNLAIVSCSLFIFL